MFIFRGARGRCVRPRRDSLFPLMAGEKADVCPVSTRPVGPAAHQVGAEKRVPVRYSVLPSGGSGSTSGYQPEVRDVQSPPWACGGSSKRASAPAWMVAGVRCPCGGRYACGEFGTGQRPVLL